jgi:hypothetical protein
MVVIYVFSFRRTKTRHLIRIPHHLTTGVLSLSSQFPIVRISDQELFKNKNAMQSVERIELGRIE